MIEIHRLREVTDETLKELLVLSRELHKDERNMQLKELEALAHDENVIIMTAMNDGHIIGIATLYVFQKIGKVKTLIEDVIVDAAYRGQGIGEKLVVALISAARERGAKDISLTSDPRRVAAHGLYAKLGFKKRDTDYFRLSL